MKSQRTSVFRTNVGTRLRRPLMQPMRINKKEQRNRNFQEIKHKNRVPGVLGKIRKISFRRNRVPNKAQTRLERSENAKDAKTIRPHNKTIELHDKTKEERSGAINRTQHIATNSNQELRRTTTRIPMRPPKMRGVKQKTKRIEVVNWNYHKGKKPQQAARITKMEKTNNNFTTLPLRTPINDEAKHHS